MTVTQRSRDGGDAEPVRVGCRCGVRDRSGQVAGGGDRAGWGRDAEHWDGVYSPTPNAYPPSPQVPESRIPNPESQPLPSPHKHMLEPVTAGIDQDECIACAGLD